MTDTTIPARLNLVILVAAIAATTGVLWLASHADAIWLMVAAAIVFSFVNNTIFSLLHEALHGIFHPRNGVNKWAGRLAACFFPTSFSIQRAFHLTHHRYNRSADEQFDLIRPGDNKALKIAQWYCILTGLYGLSPTIFCVLYGSLPTCSACAGGRARIPASGARPAQRSISAQWKRCRCASCGWRS